MASPSHDRHNFFRREIHDETKAFIWKIIVDLHLGFLMVPMAGFEPATSWIWVRRSNRLNYTGKYKTQKKKLLDSNQLQIV